MEGIFLGLCGSSRTPRNEVLSFPHGAPWSMELATSHDSGPLGQRNANHMNPTGISGSRLFFCLFVRSWMLDLAILHLVSCTIIVLHTIYYVLPWTLHHLVPGTIYTRTFLINFKFPARSNPRMLPPPYATDHTPSNIYTLTINH